MNRLLALAGAHKAAAALVAVVVVGGVVNVLQPTTATVHRVVDGDTLDVLYDGEQRRVRLLNIDTPESVDPNRPAECLGSEATAFLQGLLPPGTEVTLEHDGERRDRYGRELAAVYKEDLLVSAEIARAGLGVAVVFGENDRFYDDVAAAQEEAQEAQRGLYSTEVECTLPAQVQALEEATTAAQSEIPAPPATPSPDAVTYLEVHAAEVAAVGVMARQLLRALRGATHVLPLSAFDEGARAAMRRSVEESSDRIESARSRTDRALSEARRAWAAKQAAERRAAEEAARMAEAQRAAEEAARQAAEEAARRAQQATPRKPSRPSTSGSSGNAGTPRPTPAPAPTSAPSGGDSSAGDGSGGAAKYTGCRSYAPGGKTWTPIPC